MKCSWCNTNILFGGKKINHFRFCSDRCALHSSKLSNAELIPVEIAEIYAEKLHNGPCPRCMQPGQVGVHSAHKVWSFLIYVEWSSNQFLSCNNCAAKKQLNSLLFSLAFGWWSVLGIFITPIQILYNIIEGNGLPKDSKDPQLIKMARIAILEKEYRSLNISNGPK